MSRLFPDEGGEETLRGGVERVTYHDAGSGFCVLRVQVAGRRQPVAVVGRAASVSAGEDVECRGKWVRDPKHGRQFQASEIRTIPPRTAEGIRKYLSSGMVRGIGPHFAKKLVAAFGERVFDVIENEPERLLELPGIGPGRQERLLQAWNEQRVVRDILVFLQSHGLGTARAVRIYQTYGDDAVARIRQDPYRLTFDVRGFGFRSADDLARRLGIEADAPMRVRAGVRHVLDEAAAAGHCAVPLDELAATASRLLEVGEDRVREATDEEIAEGGAVAEPVEGATWVFPAALHRAETGVAQRLADLARGRSRWAGLDVSRAIPWVEERTGLVLSPSQAQAVSAVLANKVAVVTGGPGVGKTTLLNGLLDIVQAKKAAVALCAPTGRAAKRMSQSTGREAKTIHRLLEVDPRHGGFRRGPERPLDADLVVLDEASMVDVVLMHSLLRALPARAALWIVGDADQIPSVGPGAVLSDVIQSRAVTTVRLTEVFRQAARSRIVVNAHRIHRGEMPLADPDGAGDFFLVHARDADEIRSRLLQVVLDRIPGRFRLDPVRDVQVLTPMNRGPLGALALNDELRERLNPDGRPRIERGGTTFAAGDKVIQLVNDYDKDVFNGDIGRVVSVDAVERTAVLEFDGRELAYEEHELDDVALAYATTIHKSQGSEYPAVVLVLSSQHHVMLERNLLYTAVTRGRRLVVVIAESKALGRAVRNSRAGRRRTALSGRLRSAAARRPTDRREDAPRPGTSRPRG